MYHTRRGSKTSMANRELNMSTNISQLFVVIKYTHTHSLSALALAFDNKNECLHMKLQTASISLHSCSTKTSMIHREMSLCASALKLFPGHFGYP